MFNTLIESKPQKQRSAGASLFSAIFHAGLIAMLVAVTANAGQQMREERRQEDLSFVEMKKEPPPPEPEKAPPPPEVIAAPPPPKGFQVLTAPIEIPDKIPEVDLSKAITDEADFTGKGVAGGTSKGVVGGTGPVNVDQPFFDFQVEKPALAREGNPAPRYPSMLQSSGVEGEVLVQFVIDTTGRADMRSLKVLKSSNDLFTQSVRSVLPEYRFYPAETGGRKVKMYVQMPFTFKINR